METFGRIWDHECTFFLVVYEAFEWVRGAKNCSKWLMGTFYAFPRHKSWIWIHFLVVQNHGGYLEIMCNYMYFFDIVALERVRRENMSPYIYCFDTLGSLRVHMGSERYSKWTMYDFWVYILYISLIYNSLIKGL